MISSFPNQIHVTWKHDWYSRWHQARPERYHIGPIPLIGCLIGKKDQILHIFYCCLKPHNRGSTQRILYIIPTLLEKLIRDVYVVILPSG